MSEPESGDAAFEPPRAHEERRLSFGVIAPDLEPLRRALGKVAHVVRRDGRDLGFTRIERLDEDLNVVVTVPTKQW